MKIAVLNFSGNVGKSTVARHLLAPRIPNAEVIAVETLNAGEDEHGALSGRDFADLQDYLMSVDHDVIVDIGASNVEELLALMEEYSGSHEDFDYFIVPTVPEPKQQQDTIATLAELARLGVPAERIRVIFNRLQRGGDVARTFYTVLSFLDASPVARASTRCKLRNNAIYALARTLRADITSLATDTTDYRAQAAALPSAAERFAMRQHAACRRLAVGVVPELDACFAALELGRDGSTIAFVGGAS